MKTLVVGAAVIDMILVIDKLPKSGEDVFTKGNKTTVGGCAYNVATTMKNLGCNHDLCVPVGNGSYGEIIKHQLAKDGYPILIEETSQDNGYCLCIVEADGERTFITVPGVEGEFNESWFENIDMSQYDKVYIAGYQACDKAGMTLCKWLKTLQCQVVFAPGPVICQIDQEVINDIWDMHPIVHLNDKEILDYTGASSIDEGLEILYNRVGNVVIVTCGEQGAKYYDGEKIHHIDGYKAEVVDTIGAGDSHIGAIMAGLSKGLSFDEAIKIANKVAAQVVSVQGAVIEKEEFIEKFGEVKWKE